jgi:Transposase DDE domain
MSRETFAALPRVFLMRELWVRGGRRGFRTKEFVVVTSLVDASKHPRTELAELYRARWHAELDIRSIKQTMWIDLLRCKTPKLVRKEIWAHLLMCNLICGAMAEAARRHNVMPRQLSLQGAWQTLKAFRAELTCVPTGVAMAMTEVVLGAIAFHRVGNRPDRVEPRVIKRRLKAYPRMQVARRLARKRLMKVA